MEEKEVSGVSSISEDDVKRYAPSQYARKAVSVICGTIAPFFGLSPLFCAPLRKYKKKFAVLFALFLTAIVLCMACLAVGCIAIECKNGSELYHVYSEFEREAKYATKGRIVTSWIPEAVKTRDELEQGLDDARATDSIIYKIGAENFEQNGREYIEKYNNLPKSVKQCEMISKKYTFTYGGEEHSFFVDRDVEVTEYPLREGDLDYTATFSEVWQAWGIVADNYYLALDITLGSIERAAKYAEQTIYDNRIEGIDENSPTFFDEDCIEKLNKLYFDYKEAYRLSDIILWGVFVGGCGSIGLFGFILHIIAFVNLCALRSNKKKNKFIIQVEDEVKTMEGKKAKKQFMLTLKGLSKASDTQGFIGEVKTSHARYEQWKAEQKALAVSALQSSANAQAPAETTSEKPREYIKPKTTERGRKAVLASMSVIYGLLFVLGVLLVAVPPLRVVLYKMGICEEISARAYAITIGTMWLALLPTFGLYFATISPVTPNRKGRKTLFALSVVFSVVFDIAFFLVIYLARVDGYAINTYFEGSDSWFVPTSMVFATLGLIISYLLTMFKLNPEKIENKKPQKRSDKISDLIGYVLVSIGYVVLKGIKAILKFKESRPEAFISVATLLLTLLAFFTSFVVAIIFIVAFVGVIIMLFMKVIEIDVATDGSSGARTIRDSYGNEVEVELLPYSENGEKVYSDKYGNKWYSSDGKNFHN